MSSMHWKSWRVAGAVGAVVLAGGVLVAGTNALTNDPVSAQSPSPSPSASPAPDNAGGRHGPHRHGLGHLFGRWMDRGDFAARLAQALGIPQEQVEQAFQQLRDQVKANVLQRLEPAATQLGVTPQQLADAMEAAGRSLFQNHTRGQRPDRSAFADAVAQHLGGNVTGDQVEAALSDLRDTARQNRPDRQQVEQRMQDRLEALAAALGVTPDQLRAAFEEFRPAGFPGRGR
ncbi:MAG: Clp protease N-terminal domain-containing protein [Dehalococcoidia bacterium]